VKPEEYGIIRGGGGSYYSSSPFGKKETEEKFNTIARILRLRQGFVLSVIYRFSLWAMKLRRSYPTTLLQMWWVKFPCSMGW